MNPKVKAKWVTALRSGEYTQGKGQLNRNNEEFCCLGVLCEVAVAEGIIEKYSEGLRSSVDYGYDGRYPDDAENQSYTIEYDVLPYKVREWAGIESSNPDITHVVKENENSGSLSIYAPEDKVDFPISEFNDELNYTFSMLADAIEEQL